MSGVQNPYRYQYETIAASQTAQVLGGTGAVGDYLQRLIITCNNNTAASVTLTDGSLTGVLIVPATTPVGIYSIQIGACSASGAWKITTGSGVTVMTVGIFSA